MTRLLKLIITCTLLTISVCAQEEPTPGTISGKVVNESGQALPGASLFVRLVNSGSTVRNTITDAEGNFRVNGLDPGLYTIAATAPAYTLDNTGGPILYRTGDSAQLQLIRGGVITGTVTNALGEPVIGVRVRAARVRDAKGQIPRLPSFGFLERQTDDRGVYRIYGMPPGSYVISAGGGSGFSSLFSPYDSDVPTYSPSSTRDNAAEITVRAGDEMTADIRYRGEPGYSISGTVKVAGTGGATVTLTAANGSMPLISSFQNFGRGFVFNGLAEGEYKLMAQEVSGPVTPVIAQSDIKRVTVKGANVSGIELLTKPLGSVSGRIVLEPSKLPECEGKRPPLFAETVVNVQRHEKDTEGDDPMYQRMSGSIAVSDGSGAFVLRNLRPGRYRFEPRFYARHWYLQSITTTAGAGSQKLDLVANPAVLKPGQQLSNITITLAGGGASIRGRVALAEGTAVPANTVYLVPVDPGKVEDVLRYFVTGIAADGSFALNNLPPGKYLLLAQVNSDTQVATLAKLRQPEAAAARSKLRRTAESRQTEIQLKPCQNVADYQLKQ